VPVQSLPQLFNITTGVSYYYNTSTSWLYVLYIVPTQTYGEEYEMPTYLEPAWQLNFWIKAACFKNCSVTPVGWPSPWTSWIGNVLLNYEVSLYHLAPQWTHGVVFLQFNTYNGYLSYTLYHNLVDPTSFILSSSSPLFSAVTNNVQSPSRGRFYVGIGTNNPAINAIHSGQLYAYLGSEGGTPGPYNCTGQVVSVPIS